MSKNRVVLALMVLVAASSIGLWVTREPRPDASAVMTKVEMPDPLRTNATPENPEKISLAELQSFVTSESGAVGRLDDANEESERRLDETAVRLEIEGMKWLAERALTQERPEDERFLAADLLARSYDPAVLPVLESLVTVPFEGRQNAESTEGTIEWLVRARALEGFENFASGEAKDEAADRLRSVTTRMSSTFLAERGASILRRFEEPQAKTIQEEDAEKLRESLAR